MEKTIIDTINTAITTDFGFIKAFGFTRVSDKKDGSSVKKYPTTINIYTPNCNDDKEVYITPDRDESGLLWWEMGASESERLFQNVNKLSVKLTAYVWLNTDKINQDDMNDTTYASQIANAIPEEIEKTGVVIKGHIQNISYTIGDAGFKKYNFDKMFARKPYICFIITMNAEIYYNCLGNLTIKEYDACGNLES